MNRTYTVMQHVNTSAKPITTASYDDPETALAQFRRSLRGAGHGDAAVARHLEIFTMVLMKGGAGYAVINPDMSGSFEITITMR